ncbi:hypothetical protein SKAU_G00390710 [Synaphobranchus kaupii]|uniref:Uncharacterized protein n=1 Tax=Synaphobranchus kaupii TaxID=118154 RepID=A0A9Q1IDK8_SYNKA|nr:hypothetical protein SKAU_G00390710 [Synaphobranchus kaupii]
MPRSSRCANVRLAAREGRWGESRRPSPPRPPPRSAHSASWPNFEDHYLMAIKTAAAASCRKLSTERERDTAVTPAHSPNATAGPGGDAGARAKPGLSKFGAKRP